jgi:hypothetical protein
MARRTAMIAIVAVELADVVIGECVKTVDELKGTIDMYCSPT